MTNSELTEKLALFFFFALLDETKAQAATIKALQKIRWRTYLLGKKETELRVADFIRLTQQIYRKISQHTKPVTMAISVSSISLPENSNWGPWFELRKSADQKDFFTTVYSKILKFRDEEVAEGLGISVGTVRYRVGRAVKVLGDFCQKSAGVQIENRQ